MNLDELRKRTRLMGDSYRRGESRPLGGYVRAMGTYAAVLVASTVAVKASGRPLPDRIGPYDLLLLGVATHKTSRTLTKEAITSPLRAPFTSYVGASGHGEVVEQVSDAGHRHAVGELLTCPFCMAQWVATGFTVGLVLAPKLTRLALTVMVARTIADTLQFAYAAGQDQSQRETSQ
jgi:hypothetical protein